MFPHIYIINHPQFDHLISQVAKDSFGIPNSIDQLSKVCILYMCTAATETATLQTKYHCNEKMTQCHAVLYLPWDSRCMKPIRMSGSTFCLIQLLIILFISHSYSWIFVKMQKSTPLIQIHMYMLHSEREGTKGNTHTSNIVNLPLI